VEPVIVVRSERHPHEIGLLVACCLIGVVGVLLFPYVTSLPIQALHRPFGHVLFGGVALLSGIALGGALRRTLAGSLVHRAGLFGLSLFLLIYAGMVVAGSGARGTIFVIFVSAVAVENIIRMRQIRQEIEQRQAVEALVKDGAGHDMDQ
jgi:hypothetical protein